MKQVIAILLAIVCVLVLGGCRTENEGSGVCPPSSTEAEQGGEEQKDEENGEEDVVVISCGDKVLEIQLADTVSARALKDRLAGGEISVAMRAYGGFEMVGALGFSLERDDVNMTTRTGDVVLYSGDQLVIFYDSNSWAYTKIGHIRGATRESLENFFGWTDKTEVTFSLKARG